LNSAKEGIEVVGDGYVSAQEYAESLADNFGSYARYSTRDFRVLLTYRKGRLLRLSADVRPPRIRQLAPVFLQKT
jgi:hypothetical protein